MGELIAHLSTFLSDPTEFLDSTLINQISVENIRQICATKKVTMKPITTGNKAATVVHFALPDSL
jgi:hypothetical protein